MNAINFIKEQLSKNDNIRWRGTDIDAILEQAEQILQKQMISIIDEVSPNWYKCYTEEDKKAHLSKIISSKIVDVPQQDEIQCNYCNKLVKNFMAIDVWMITDDNKNVCYECQIRKNIGWGKIKQPKKD
jgi:hypothetical protein